MIEPHIALVGAGWVVRNVWAPLLVQHNAHIVSVIDPQTDASTAFPAMSPGPRWHRCMSDQALHNCNLALICSPNVHHVQQALRAMGQGLHVILEKPACLSSADAEQLIRCSRETGAELLVSAAAAHRSDVRAMAAARGALGTLHCIDVSWRRRRGVPRPGSWFTQASQALAGSGADLGWHLLEVALHALDYPLIDAALCNHVPATADEAQQQATWRGDQGPGGTIEVESQSFSCLQARGGTLVRMSTAWASHQEHDETRITLYGSAGELCLRTTFGFSQNRIQQPSLTLTVDGTQTSLAFAAEDNLAPYRDFLGSRIASLGTCAQTREHEYRKLRSLASAMSALYPHLTPSCTARPGH
ncbi:Gfo/Idh/MocA family protein [Pseudomonas protegens]|uniref:Gfo/Idh/MocA family protein n=1 Tax=Pseudomonas protegens TaxID=380021 RepID=UPI001A916EA7|nr:Gfo/Idh/MocA family oxidoreductase [Pseudomonas protegens]